MLVRVVDASRWTRAETARSAALALVLAGSILAAAPGPAAPAQDPVPDWQPTYERLIAELMSPYCHGLTLDNCPTKGAEELRNQIRTWLAEGRTEEWIFDELELQFGPSIFGAPRMRGIGLLAWIVPPVFLIVGAIGVVLFLRRNTAAAGRGEATP